MRQKHRNHESAPAYRQPSPLVFLKHDTASLLALSRLDSKAQKAVARLLTLPDSNPAAVLARAAVRHPRKTHLSNLHHALQNPSHTLARLKNPIEVISQIDVPETATHPRVRSLIASSKEAAAFFVQSQLGHFPRDNCTRAISFSDGSLIPEVG